MEEETHNQQEDGWNSCPCPTGHAFMLDLKFDLVGILTLNICKEEGSHESGPSQHGEDMVLGKKRHADFATCNYQASVLVMVTYEGVLDTVMLPGFG